MSPYTHSPVNHFSGAIYHYPDIWRKIDEQRAISDWPDWCFIPGSEIRNIIRPDWLMRIDKHNGVLDAERLAGLAAWRVTQGIYRFDPDLYASLKTTPVETLPAELITLMPEWGVYIETPDKLSGCSGFFASCDYDVQRARTSLRLLLDTVDNLVPVSIPVRHGSLVEVDCRNTSSVVEVKYQPMVSLVLYLCSVAADFGHYTALRPQAITTKKGPRLFPPDKPTVVQTGEQIGSLLRASQGSRPSVEKGECTGKHVAAHIRRAHWHGYWLSKPRRFEIRWMPPVLVNSDVTPGHNVRVR